MTTLTKKDSGSKPFHSKKSSKKDKQPVKSHCKISLEDINWIREQEPCVRQLWLDCIAAEQFGGSAHTLKTSLDIKGKSFRKAKSLLEQQGLFKFEPIHELKPNGQSIVAGWKVINLHGYYKKSYWEEDTVNEHEASGSSGGGLGKEVPHLRETVGGTSGSSTPYFGKFDPDLQPETIEKQELEEIQLYSNHQSTTSQLPTKVVREGVERLVVGSSKEPPQLSDPLEGVAAAAASAEEEFVPGERPQCWIDAGEKLKQFVNARKAERRSRFLGADSISFPSKEQETTGNANNVQGADNNPSKDSHSPEVGESFTPGEVILNPTNASKTQPDSIEKKFSEYELREKLDLAAKGVFPGLDALNQAMTSYLRLSAALLVRVHPEWGVKISKGRVIYVD